MTKRSILFTGLGAIVVAGILSGWFFVSRSSQTAQHTYTYDVVVVGAGPGGIGASIQAARMGEHVALLEPTDWIGGQITAAGVGSMDEGNINVRNHGLYKEFAQKVIDYYTARGKSVDTCYYGADSLCVDAQVGQTILRQMLQAESTHLDVYTQTPVTSVLKDDSTVTGVVSGNRTFSAKIVIDADEYGDVLAQAGAAFRLGNGTSTHPATSASACVQNMTYTAIIKQYPNGLPGQLRFSQAPPGYNQTIARHFAALLTQNGYDHFISHGKNPMDFASYVGYRGLPDLSNTANYDVFQQNGHTITRTALNLGNDYPLSGTLSTKFVSDPTYRAQTICKAKLLTLQLIYYIQHDIDESDWSIANDEGYDTPYNQTQHCPQLAGYEAFENQMPPDPYIREARRLIGTQTITGNQLAISWRTPSATPTFGDSIAVGYYPMDLHACKSANTLESSYDSTTDIKSTYAGGAFEVPMGALIPEKIDGLLAAEKNISASREASGAIREQPISMDIGQAAGALAAIAIQQHVQPRAVDPASVQHVLHLANLITSITQK